MREANLNLLTGWNLTLEDCLLVSERIWNLNRAHYLERNGGPGRLHDVAPKRHLEEPVPSGPAKGNKVGTAVFNTLLDNYYRARGWDPEGNPTREILAALDLTETADNLEHLGLLGQPLPNGIPPVRGQELKPKAM